MICMECGADAVKGYTTSVTDVGTMLIIVRNVPCWKCTRCNETIYTADVLKRLEEINKSASMIPQEVSILDYKKAA